MVSSKRTPHGDITRIRSHITIDKRKIFVSLTRLPTLRRPVEDFQVGIVQRKTESEPMYIEG